MHARVCSTLASTRVGHTASLTASCSRSCVSSAGSITRFPAHRAQARGGWVSQRCVVVRSADGGRSPSPNDPYSAFYSSPFLQNNPMVFQEFQSMVNEMVSLSRISSKFAEFDVTGKRMYLDKMREASESYELFIKRLELSGDPSAKDFLRAVGTQMAAGGASFHSMFAGLKDGLRMYEELVVAEERAIAAGPTVHAEFLKDMKEHWRSTAMGAIDMDWIFKRVTPEVMMRAQNDPQFWTAVREISERPTTEVLRKWMDNPNLAPLIGEMAKAMMMKSMNASGPSQ